MKTILIMSQNAVFDLGNGAGKEVIFKTLNELAKQFHVELIAPGNDPQIKNCRFHNLPDNLFNKLKNIPIIGFLYNFLYLIQLKWVIKETITNKSLNPDLVYLAGPWMSNIGHSIYENKIPIVVRYYGVNWVPERHHSMRQKIKFYLKNKGYKKFGDLVIMTNDGTRGDEFLDHMNCPQNKRLFLPNGIDFKQSSIKKVEAKKKLANTYKILETNKILLTVSRLTSWKRVDRAILGLKEALKYDNQISLVIVGDGEEKSRLERLVDLEGLRTNVHFAGSIKHEFLSEYYIGCDAFLSLYDYSNAGNPLFEAMLNRCCIITLDSPAMKHFISTKGAIMLKESSATNIGLGIIEALKNENYRLELGINAEQEVKENLLSWEERIAFEVGKIKDLLGQSKH